MKISYSWFTILRLSVFLIFLGRAYQFFFFGAPFRAFLWDESMLSPFIETILNISWQEYATNTIYSDRIELFTKICSIILFSGALLALLWNFIKNVRLKKIIISTGVFILIIMGICIFKDKNYSLLQFFELFIQLSLPIALITGHNDLEKNTSRIQWGLKIALSVTFLAHGLYAMGIPFYPGHFIDMTINITGLTEDQSKIFLTVAGMLDVLAAIGIYYKRTLKYALIYILIWGLLTALARVVSGFNASFVLDSIHNSLYATIYRIPHGLIAIILILITYTKLQKSKIEIHEI